MISEKKSIKTTRNHSKQLAIDRNNSQPMKTAHTSLLEKQILFLKDVTKVVLGAAMLNTGLFSRMSEERVKANKRRLVHVKSEKTQNNWLWKQKE